ncbi:MAG: Na+/H+ antiporter NhaA [Actinobacteria bacterium]|nr:Na+/H+ antiporter NhaA [Actinomycetota bacterium]
MHRPHHQHTWLGSDRALARFVGRPVTRFLAIETSGGALLLAAAVVALVWANSPWASSYASFWGTELRLEIGSFSLDESLVAWVNDGLMAIFFFVAGLEIKRELVHGELRNPKAAALPLLGAVGGMLVPALAYLALNGGTAASRGFGIPVATDIAFAVGVVALLGKLCPPSLKLFLLTLAIADDLGGILVIAVFYAGGIQYWWLAVTAAGLGLVYLMRRAGIRYLPVYLAVGVGIWLAMYESGVHPTVAGVLLGLLTPTLALRPELDAEVIADTLENRNDLTAADVRSAAFYIQETVPIDQRLVDILHPWTSYLIIPIFALANAGIPLNGEALTTAWSSRITIGVFLGLVAGKTVGVFFATALAAKLRIAVLPSGVTKLQMLAISMAAGIGFTVALFVTELAFEDSLAMRDQAKVGIIAASIVAAVLSAFMFSIAHRRQPRAVDDDGEGSEDGAPADPMLSAVP